MWMDVAVLKGFKDFVLRGNVVDLAVAVVIGAAFTAVVNAFSTDFLTPLIGLAGGGGKLGGQLTVHGQTFKWGAFVSQLITFLLTAAVVYFLVVLPMKAFLDRRRRGEEKGPVQPTQIDLLVEIRDLLRAQQAAGTPLPANMPMPAEGPRAATAQPTRGGQQSHPPQGRQLPPVPPRRDA
jgi:large conductance mechanosensitive channel